MQPRGEPIKIVAVDDLNPMRGTGPMIDGQLLREDVADAFARGAQRAREVAQARACRHLPL